MEVFLLKNNTKKLLCILLAIAAAVCVIFACFMLTKHKQTDSASSAAASVSQFGSVADFDYEAFDYSDGLDENGYWSGIKALDYVTLPEDFGSIALKENDLTPTEDELQQQVDNLLNQYTSSSPLPAVPPRAEMLPTSITPAPWTAWPLPAALPPATT